jgi:hypothetical protein
MAFGKEFEMKHSRARQENRMPPTGFERDDLETVEAPLKPQETPPMAISILCS